MGVIVTSDANWVGPGAQFSVFQDVEFLRGDQNGVYWRWRRRISVNGDFYGTRLQFGDPDDWCNGIMMYSTGDAWVGGWSGENYTAYGNTVPTSFSAGYSGGSGTFESKCYTPIALPLRPTAPTNLSVSISGHTATLTFNRQGQPCIDVWRKVNNGAWQKIAAVYTVSTYTDNTLSADQAVQYRLQAWSSWGDDGFYSEFTAPSAAVYTEPAAPKSVSGQRRSGVNVIDFTVDNRSVTATGLEVQYSPDKSSWTAAKTVSGSPVTSFEYTTTGTYWYRARNTRGSLVSEWTVTSSQVVSLSKPNPPTVNEPSGVVELGSSFTVSWTHNPTDGSAQQGYRVYLNGVQVASGTTATSCQISTSVRGNNTITVATKGAHASYSDQSAVRVIDAYSRPTVTVSVIGTVTTMPIAYTVSHAGDGGFSSGTLAISKDGEIVYRETLAAPQSGDIIAGSIDAGEFVPTNGEDYVVTATYNADTGLSGTGAAQFSVDFVPPKPAAVECGFNEQDGSVSIVATVTQGGKNLLFMNYASLDTAGGEIKKYDIPSPIPAGEYRLSFDVECAGDCSLSLRAADDTAKIDVGQDESKHASFAFNTDVPLTQLWFWVTGPVIFSKIQLEAGLVETPFEPYMADPETVSVYRVYGQARTLVGTAEAPAAGQAAGFIDMYAPINADYAYEAITRTPSGAISSSTINARNAARYAYMVGDRTARFTYDPQDSYSVSNSSQQLTYYWGRKYPVASDGGNRSVTRSFEGRVLTRDDRKSLEFLADSGKPLLFKSLDGDTILAVMSVSIKREFISDAHEVSSFSASLTQVDGESL